MTRDNDDDVIEIDFDDEDDSDAPGVAAPGLIDVVLDDDAPPPAPPTARPPERMRRRRTPAPPVSEPDLPDPGPKVCPICGFAIPALEHECPRCARLGPERASADPPSALPPVDPAPAYPGVGRPRRRTGVVVATALVVIVILGAAALTAYLITNSPHQRARRAFEDGLRAHLGGDMTTAREKYQEALELDPDMGLAALMMGMSYLGISLSGDSAASLQGLLELAAAGDTRILDAADRWFDHAIAIANRLPPRQSLHHADIKTPAQLAAYAHALRAVTAYLRYSAGLMGDDPLSSTQWLTVMQQELQQAFALQPNNPYASDIQNQLPPL